MRPWTGRGTHGYDPYHPDMSAIFIAKGPSFIGHSQSHRLPEMRIPRIRNLDIYPLLIRLIGIQGHDHNGTDHLQKLVLRHEK